MTSYANRNFAILTPFSCGLITYLNEATFFRFPKQFHIFLTDITIRFTINSCVIRNTKTLPYSSFHFRNIFKFDMPSVSVNCHLLLLVCHFLFCLDKRLFHLRDLTL